MWEYKFQIGDPVVLKGGHLTMTIEAQPSPWRYLCVWIDERGQHQQAVYFAHSIDLVNDDAEYNYL